MVWSGARMPAKVIATAKSKSTGAPQEITFRGFRPTNCGGFQMNDAVLCGDGRAVSVLMLTVVEEDNAAVPAGVYTGSMSIHAKGWHDQAFTEILKFNYEVTIER